MAGAGGDFSNRTKPWLRRGAIAAVLALLSCPAWSAELMIGEKDLRRIGVGPLIGRDVKGFPADPNLPTVDPAETDPAARQLQGLVARGISQGFGGILYENRDRGHSILPETLYPNLTFLKYDEALKNQWLDYGLAGPILYPELVFGNSSTAQKHGKAPRSLARIAMTTPGGAARAFRDYVANSIYIYPEHKDHDEVDLYPANWPYMIVSQGSSYTDMPFMKAVAMTLAAFPQDTRGALLEAGLIAPTIQMILRRNLTMVRTRAHYLSAAAHPTVFSSKWLQVGRMIGQAAAMRPEDIPPLVRLRMVEDGFLRRAGLANRDEHLFTTPSAIARIWRDFAWEKQMVISTESTTDPNGRDLTFDWVLLRGDPARVSIEPLDPSGRSARITVNWHDAFAVRPRDPESDILRSSSRVDIGVFAWNGRTDSAPAMVSISFPTHQKRDYAVAADGTRRLVSVDYDAEKRGAEYDPLLHWSAGWSDHFSYSEEGQLTGWERITNGESSQFSDEGLRDHGAKVDYQLFETDEGKPVLQAVPIERTELQPSGPRHPID